MNNLKNTALSLLVILLAACQSSPGAPGRVLVPVGEDLAAVNSNVSVQGTLRVYDQSDIDGALGECVAEAFGTQAGSNYSFNLPYLSFGDYAVRIYYTGTRDGVSTLLLAADCPEFTHAIDGSECDIDFSVLSVLGHQTLFEARTDPLDPDTATETFGVEDCEGNVLNVSDAPITPTCKESLFDCDRNNTTNLQEAQDPNGSFFSLGVTTSGNGVSDFAQVSADSRYVAFHTTANNLSDDDLNNAEDVYVLDRQTGVLDAVTSGFPGDDGDGPSMQSSVDEIGRYVAFSSFAGNLSPGDNNNMADIFVRDREQRVVRLISQGMGATPADGNSFNPSISLDGRFVAFESMATNLVAGDTNSVSDIFVADRDVSDDGFFDEDGDTKIVRVSVDAAGAQANGASRNPSISGLGRHVAFESDASNLISGDTNAKTDVFVHDRDCDESMAANPCVDGLSGDDIFDQVGRIRTIRVSVTEAGAELGAASTNPDLSQSWDGMEDGRFVVFETMDNTIKTLLPVFEFLGFGNGGTNYMFTLAYSPVKPGSVRITAPMGMCIDNGMGMLLGGGECMGGTINYMTGDVNVNFGVAQDMSDDLFGIYALEFTDLNPRMDVYLHDRDCDPMMPFDGCQFAANGVYDEAGMNRTLLMSHSFDAIDGFITSNGFSHNPAVSGDGKIVAYDSDADNLIPLVGDFNAERDVFARVRSLGGVDQIVTMSGEMPLTCRVSQKNLDGGNGESKSPAVNVLGDRIAYETDATNLASDMDTAFDTNGKIDIVRAEVMVNTTDCISEFVTASLRATAGRNNNVISQATKDSTGAAISGDGNIVSFSTSDANMITGEFADKNGQRDIYLYDQTLPRRVERASVAQGRVQAEDAALFPTISGLGNWVAYESDAANIDFTDSGNFSDVFLYDRTTKQTSRASVSIDPITGMISEANGNSHSPSLNADPADAGNDGRFLVFESFANNIATRYETVGMGDNSTTAFNKVLFERSAVPGSFRVSDGTEICTDDMAGTLVCDNGGSGAIVYASSTLTLTFGSAPGSGVPVIATYATTESDANSLDLFVLDRDADDDNIFDQDPAIKPGAQRISRLTLNDGGGDTDSNSFRPRISADGRHVVFMSQATNLVASDANDASDIFIHDRDVDGMGTYDDGADIAIIRVSVSTAGTEANDDSERPWISSDGRYVVFDSFATNLVASDNNGESDVFLRDRDTDEDGVFDEMGAVSTVRLSFPVAGGEADGASEQGTISNDGRFVSFVSDAANLVAGDTNFFADVFVLDRDRDNNQIYDEAGETEIRRVNIPPLGRETDDESFAAWISPGGASVVLASDATNLDPLDTNNLGDIFIVPNLMAPISSAGQTLFFDAQAPQIPLDIADFSTVLSTITVDATGTLQDINVEVDISHSFSGDLTITLIAPDATEVILSDGNGDDAIDAFAGTVFDDEAPFGIVDVTPPYTGRFQPEGVLNDMQGKSVQGTWTLKVTDCCAPDGGQLDFWGIEIELQ